MKTKNLLKKAFLLLALIGGASSAWGETAVESSGNTGTNNTAVIGTSYSLGSIYVAGKGGVQQGNMPDKGVKLRSNQTNLVFEVNAGYKITKFEFWGCGNTGTAVTIVSATVDGGSDILGGNVVLPGKGTSDPVKSGDIVLDEIEAENNITLNFADGSSAQLVGTWKVTYEQTQVVVQEVTGVTLNGNSISSEDLATLKSTGALEIDGSSFNGLGTLDVTLSSGATTVSREIVDDDAVYTFSINSGANEYTITVTDVAKTYSAEGSVMYYSKNSEDIEGKNTKTVTANGISMSMVDGSKTFQYGTGSVKLGSDTYVPLKLSTGSAVNVTFPDGKVATKVIVYGWSASGNGAIHSIKETSESTDAKSLDTHEDVFYATNTASDSYPSVYEYDLDNWESLYFNPGGSTSQPFVVMDFVLVDKSVSKTVSAAGWATYCSPYALDFTGDIANLTNAYIVIGATGSTLNLTSVKGSKVAANTGILIEGSEGTVTIPVAASGTDYSSTNKLVGVTTATEISANAGYVLMADPSLGFYKNASAFTVGANTAYLPATIAGAARSAFFIGGNITAVDNVEAAAEAKAKDGKFIENGKLVIVKNGVKYNAAGAQVK